MCGTEIDEIEVPEALQAEQEGRMYYFCSPECKIEFDRDSRRFIATA